MVKGFAASYSTKTMHQGKMLIEYDCKRYVLEVREIKNPSEDIFDDINNLQNL
jgi:hypothetical protein